LHPAKDAGFSTILNATTPSFAGGRSFMQAFPEIRRQFVAIMRSASEELDALLKQKQEASAPGKMGPAQTRNK
jgi:hypothetical protein